MRALELINNGDVVRYELPTSWSEVSLGSYAKLMSALENEATSEIELIIKTLNALVGISTTELTKVPLKELKIAYAELSTLTSTLPSNELVKMIDVNGEAYGFIPDFDLLTLGEFVDLDNYLQDCWSNLHKIMAVLYRKVTKVNKDGSYEIEEYNLKSSKASRELFKDKLSIDVIYGSMVFFYALGSKLMIDMELSLEEENKRLKMRLKKEKV